LLVLELAELSGNVDPEQIEDIVGMINDMGIVVHEVAPDADTIVLSDNDVNTDEDAAEEAAQALATVDSDFGRTTDPVRMYMREMGTVELLTREGEIVIAKRIEDGIRQVMSALALYPGTIRTVLDAYKRVEDGDARLTDVITGFAADDDDIPPPVVQGQAPAKAEDGADDDSDDDAEEEVVDTGPDPEVAEKHFKSLRSLFEKYEKSAAKYGHDDDRSKKLYGQMTDELSELKLVPKLSESLISDVRSLVHSVRNHERVIMDICVTKARMPRK
jgi:RNA polymerase primary sigma factor